MKKNTLKTLGIMVLSTALLASTVTGCGSKETADVPTTEVVETVVETEVVEETEAAPEATEEVMVEDTEMVEATEVAEEAIFTVTDMSATKYAKTSANVRAGASKDYEVIGSLSFNQKVTVTGQADTGWYRIEFNGKEGYVSNSLLVDQKVAVSTPAQNTQTQNQSTGTIDNTQVQTQVQTPVVDNSGWTGDTSTYVPSTPSTPSVDTSTPVTTPSTDNSTSSAEQTLIDQGFVPFDPSTNPVEDLPYLGGIY